MVWLANDDAGLKEINYEIAYSPDSTKNPLCKSQPKKL